MIVVQFTAFIPPNGKKEPMSIAVTEDCDLRRQYQDLVERGLSFEYERLGTGVESITVEDWSNEEWPTVAHELIPPGGVLSLRVVELIKTAYLHFLNQEL